jgi:hypothetical protein
MNTLVLMSVVLLLAASVAMASYTQTVEADRDDKPHKGNFGKCKGFGDREGCKDTFTGKDHGDDEPLP